MDIEVQVLRDIDLVKSMISILLSESFPFIGFPPLLEAIASFMLKETFLSQEILGSMGFSHLLVRTEQVLSPVVKRSNFYLDRAPYLTP